MVRFAGILTLGGLHATGLDKTNPLVVVDIGHNAGADKVADRACDFLQRI